MNLQKMLSQLSPEQLEQGMKQLGLSPEQMKQVNNVAKGNSPAGGGKSGNIDADTVNAFLKSNPNLAKQAQQMNMLSKISEIFGK